LFQLLDVNYVIFAFGLKTLEHSISYNTFHWPGEQKRKKCAFRNPLHDLFVAVSVSNDV